MSDPVSEPETKSRKRDNERNSRKKSSTPSGQKDSQKLPQKLPKMGRFHMGYWVFAILSVLVLHEVWNRATQVAQVPYSEFQALLKEGKVSEVVVGDQFLQATLKEPREDKRTQVISVRVEAELAKSLSESGVKYSRVLENNWVRDVLSWVVPTLLFFGIWMLIARRMGGGGLGAGGFMSVGKSKAKVYVETDTKVTFKDVAGVDESKAELEEIVHFLKDPKAHGRLGARMPRGVLLVGPPGTGKTLLAKAVAGEAAVPFFSISGSEFVEMFVGVGAARVRDLFEQAREKAPCIIFIDELDALGRARAGGQMSPGHDEKEQTLNQLLVELDGFDSTVGIVLLGATNRPEILDPALLRAGRFDRQVLVDRPDKKGRKEILEVHAKKVKLSTAASLEEIAGLTPGFTGADLANLVNEAALVATRRKGEDVTTQDFTVAIERIVAGLEKKSRILNEKERKIVATHEMGHALVAMSLPGTDPVHKVSIIPRGMGALGYTIQRPTEDRYLMTREDLFHRMAVLMGGRVAEFLVFSHYSTGAADDLSRATEIARNMVVKYGMDTGLGHPSLESEPGGFLGNQMLTVKKYSDDTAHEVDRAVKRLMDEAFASAKSILESKRSALETGAARLLLQETLEAVELEALLRESTT
jgi:cell division protease FtsH